MPDFYADHPFPEVALEVLDAQKFCAIGDVVIGMKSGMGRVERFINGGILVHPVNDQIFVEGDNLVCATNSAEILKISNVTMDC